MLMLNQSSLSLAYHWKSVTSQHMGLSPCPFGPLISHVTLWLPWKWMLGVFNKKTLSNSHNHDSYHNNLVVWALTYRDESQWAVYKCWMNLVDSAYYMDSQYQPEQDEGQRLLSVKWCHAIMVQSVPTYFAVSMVEHWTGTIIYNIQPTPLGLSILYNDHPG